MWEVLSREISNSNILESILMKNESYWRRMEGESWNMASFGLEMS